MLILEVVITAAAFSEKKMFAVFCFLAIQPFTVGKVNWIYSCGLFCFRYDALCILLRHSKNVRFWFAHNVLFNVSNRFSEYLLECPSAEVRGAFAKLIVFIAHFSLQDGPCPSPFASPGPSSQVIVPLFIINYLCNPHPPEVRETWMLYTFNIYTIQYIQYIHHSNKAWSLIPIKLLDKKQQWLFAL